jgi:hypothetical protein
MGIEQDTAKVKKNILSIYQRRKIKLYALATSYAGKAINIFRREQGEQTFWTNQTNDAYKRMFAKQFARDDEIGFFLSHGVEYGIYLELANDRQFEAIRPIMMSLAPQFIKDARKVIEGTV